MYVPVWGHHTNTMNVDITNSVFFFLLLLLPKVFSNISAQRCHAIGYLEANKWTDILGLETEELMATTNNLLVFD